MTTTTGFAKKICAAWQQSLRGILECGRLLNAAKQKLKHGQFQQMIKAELPFGESTAQRLMAIARDRRLTNPAHAQLLPPSWYLLYRLHTLPDAQFEAAITDGTIRPDMERDDIPVSLMVVSKVKTAPAVHMKVNTTPTTVPVPHYTRSLPIEARGYVMPEASDAAKHAQRLIESLELLEELADESVMDEVAELLRSPARTNHLIRVRRAINAIRQLEATLDQMEVNVAAENQMH